MPTYPHPDFPLRDLPESAYMPMTFPDPVPDYTPEELAKIEAAEEKRNRKLGLDWSVYKWSR